MKVLVAGASGVLGRLVIAEAMERGLAVRALSRSGVVPSAVNLEVWRADALRPATLHGACSGVDVVFSSLGASVDPSPFAGWSPYTRVDTPANLALLAEAKRAGVRRFVYTSLNGGDAARHLDYAEGHERVVDALRASGLPCTVLRPTGFFAAMTAFVDMARRGGVMLFGDGSARTNPIDERDLAKIAVDEMLVPERGVRTVACGGPEVFTRREIADLCGNVLGKRARVVSMSRGLAHNMGHALRLVSPRTGRFLQFAAYVMTHDCIAPAVGTRRLEDALRAYVEQRRVR